MEQMGTNHPHPRPHHQPTWTINHQKLGGGSRQCPLEDTSASNKSARLTTGRRIRRRQVDVEGTSRMEEEEERDKKNINKEEDYYHYYYYCANASWYRDNKLLHNNSHTTTNGSSSCSSSSRSDSKCHLNDHHSHAHPSRRSHWKRRKSGAANRWQPSSVLILARNFNRNNNLYLLALALSMCIYITPVKAGHQAGTITNNLNASNLELVDLDVDGPTLYGLRRFSLPTKYIFGGGGDSSHNKPTPARNNQQQLAASASNSFDSRSIFRYELTGGRSAAPTQATSAAAAAPRQPEMGRLQHQQDGNNNNRLASIQSQLSELRRQLELELSLERGQVTLGSPCFNGSDCRNSIVNSHCKLDNFTCSCLPHHIQYNSTTCLPPSLLGFECLIDAQCQQKVHGSYCSSANLCACRSQFVTYRKDKCLPASKINDYCLTDSQCQLYDKHSHCKWKITNIYGLCKCPPNYKHISLPANNNGSMLATERGHSETMRANGGTSSNIRCAPRLGDSCFTDEECQLATRNSVCQEPKPFPYSRLSITWRSSGASTRRCYCGSGFTESANKLDCQRQAQTSSSSTGSRSGATTVTAHAIDGGETATTASIRRSSVPTAVSSVPESALLAAPNSMNAKNHYEFIMPPQAVNQTVAMQVNAPHRDSQEFDTRSSADQVLPATSIIIINPTTQPPPSKVPDRNQLNRLNTPHGGPPAASKNNETTSFILTTTSTQRPRQLTRRPPIPVVSNALGSGGGSGSKVATGSGHQARPLPAGMRVSSLGKPCSSRVECQARDRHSDCLNGFCECIRPTSRCMANSTGCHKDTFQCRNGQCISWYFVCDQFRNCDDGSDEDECIANSCPPEAFQCDSGLCLARGKLCNGKLDCADGSDERHCSAGASTSRVTTQTSTSSLQPTLTTAAAAAAVAKTSTSDGQLAEISASGADSSRQQQQLLANSYGTTSPPLSSCHPRAFACDNGQCLPAYVFCNAVEDCSDGSDEIERVCERVWPNRKWGQPLGNATTTTSTAATQTASRQHLASQPNHRSRLRSNAENHHPLDSPLVRSDRISMEKLLAASLTGRTPEGRGRGPLEHRQQQQQQNRMEFSENIGSGGGRRRRTPGASHQQRQRNLSPKSASAYTCPKTAFTCRNGKCRSSAILCSGVDGCGDNSDEDRCEVCQCAAP